MAELRVGDRAPDFTLQAADGGIIRLAGLRGSRVVLYFYPKDDTPGCTREACGFRDELAGFRRAGAAVLGISPDDVASHARFTKKFSLPFPLLSDPGAAVSKAYGVYKQKSLYGRTYLGIERTTFIIDEQGRIARIFPRVKVDGHIEAILAQVRAQAPQTAGTAARQAGAAFQAKADRGASRGRTSRRA